MIRLKKDDLAHFKTDREEAIELVKNYSRQYRGAEHYDKLGLSCTTSVNGTINAITGSTEYLDGVFLMPDTINIDKVVDWFLENRDYDRDRSVLTFYMANCVKKRINRLYRKIKSN